MKLKLKELIMQDGKGGKVTISFENVSSEDIAKVIKKLQDESTTTEERSELESTTTLNSNLDYDSLTIREKLELIVKQIKHGWFTSDHIRELYHYHFHEEIKPSTVSTYLARMFNENDLERRGSRARREYRVAEKEISPIEYVNQV